MPITPAVGVALTSILPQLSGQLLDAYARKAELDFKRYEAELERVRHDTDLMFLARQNYLEQEFTLAEATRNRAHDLRRIWEEAKVGLWYSAEREAQETRNTIRPFLLSSTDLRRMLYSVSHQGRQPLILFAPLSDESKSADESDISPQFFRTGLRNYWAASPWSSLAEPLDGLFSRPLYRGDVDIYLVREELGDLPIVLVKLHLQASGRMWLTITAWGMQPERAAIRIQFPCLPMPTSRGTKELITAPDLLQIEDEICTQFAPIAAALLDWFHLARGGRLPCLHRTLPSEMEAQRPVIAAGSLAAFLIAERDGVLNRLDALVGATQVAIEGELNLAAGLLASVRKLIAEEPDLIGDRTASGLASLSAAARVRGDLAMTSCAYEALELVTRQLLHNLPGGGL